MNNKFRRRHKEKEALGESDTYMAHPEQEESTGPRTKREGAKSYKGCDVVEKHDHPCSEQKRHIEEEYPDAIIIFNM